VIRSVNNNPARSQLGVNNFHSPAIRDREWAAFPVAVDTSHFAAKDLCVEVKCFFAGAWK